MSEKCRLFLVRGRLCLRNAAKRHWQVCAEKNFYGKHYLVDYIPLAFFYLGSDGGILYISR